MKRTIFGLLVLAALYDLPTFAQEGGGRANVLARPAAEGRVSQGVAAIERAAAAQKYIFVFFWKEKNQQTDRTWSMLQPAAAKMADWAEVAAVQVTDPAEQELVARYDLSRTPLPLVMAIAPCGAIKEQIVTKLVAAQNNPCAGGKCGPNGCGPKK